MIGRHIRYDEGRMMASARGERGEIQLLLAPWISAWALIFLAVTLATLVFGPRWGLVTLGAVVALVGGSVLLFRLIEARLPAPLPTDPARLAELNQPHSAAGTAAALADFIPGLVSATEDLRADDRDRLDDLERRLRLRVGETRPTPREKIEPYYPGDMFSIMAQLSAEQLLVEGGPEGGLAHLAKWSPPSPAEAAALSWFVDNFDRIDMINVKRLEQERLAAQGPVPRWLRGRRRSVTPL